MKSVKYARMMVFVLAAITFAVPVKADEMRVFDDAGVFMEEEVQVLNEALLETEEEHGYHISVLVTNDIGSDKSEEGARNYAAAYYNDKFGTDSDGVFYMMNRDTDYDLIFTSGKVVGMLPESKKEEFLDFCWQDNINGDSFGAMLRFCHYVNLYATGESDEVDYSKSDEVRLFDDAGYFSEEEAGKLNALLLKTEADVGYYVAVVVADDIGADKSNDAARLYADIYYEDKFGIDTDGMLFLINIDTKHDRISTSGKVEEAFPHRQVEKLFDSFWGDMVNKEFYSAVEKFCYGVPIYDLSYTGASGASGAYSDYGLYFDFDEIAPKALIGGSVGAVISLIIVISVLYRYKIRPVHGAANYLDANSVKYHQQTDTFIRKYVTAHRIESSSGGGGGGGRSSGGSHGGGGRSR